jgi:DNA-binding beta-propeller fold protein YncE
LKNQMLSTHLSVSLCLIGASLAAAQGADSILLDQSQILQVNRDPQGNLLVAQLSGTTVALYQYSPQGQLLQSFTGPGQTLNTGANGVVLATDSQGVLYLGSANELVRPADDPPGAWIPNLPSTAFLIDAIGFDPQNNPILAITIIDPPNADGRLLKLDRTTGEILANLDIGVGVAPTALTVDSGGAVYVTGLQYLTGFAAKFDPKLQSQLYFASLDSAMPHGIAVDPAGSAYIAETPLAVPVTFGPPNGGAVIHFGTNTVHKLDPSGVIVVSNSGGGSSIALDAGGNVIVVGGATRRPEPSRLFVDRAATWVVCRSPCWTRCSCSRNPRHSWRSRASRAPRRCWPMAASTWPRRPTGFCTSAPPPRRRPSPAS